ncbi:hypothetical protein E2C01_089997 [Portunus trituberculatus]|uniref:Uncharacterized protein n=1 Tax=Portunus trituberculatus TaxID=210409 RepID=A0A5B7JAB0_PORTR|nr:hypothetical protein [Portunus trituberculatus]
MIDTQRLRGLNAEERDDCNEVSRAGGVDTLTELVSASPPVFTTGTQAGQGHYTSTTLQGHCLRHGHQCTTLTATRVTTALPHHQASHKAGGGVAGFSPRGEPCEG